MINSNFNTQYSSVPSVLDSSIDPCGLGALVFLSTFALMYWTTSCGEYGSHADIGLSSKAYLMSLHRPMPFLPWDIIKWKHFPRYWPFVRGINQSPVNSHHKGKWRGALMFSFIGAWINVWVNNRAAGNLRCHCAHYVIVMGGRI